MSMPNIGEIKRARDIGIKTTRGHTKYMRCECPVCKKERWVALSNTRTSKFTGLCQQCNNKRQAKLHPHWKGGRVKTKAGYIRIKVYPDDFFYSMAGNRGYVPEHRLVVAKALGRCLHPWEIVHHKNHIKDDNRIENLQLTSDDRHKQISLLEARIKQLESRVTLLEAENVALKTEQSPTSL